MAEKKLIFHYSLGPLAEKYHPKIIVESGTHSGRTAAFMCSIALKYNNDVEYTAKAQGHMKKQQLNLTVLKVNILSLNTNYTKGLLQKVLKIQL
jgi:hypothetical protein